MKKIILILLILTAFAFTLFLIFTNSSNKSAEQIETKTPQTNQIEYPFTAKFAIFTNNTFRIFTDSKYHNQSAAVYITNDNPNYISITNNEITWGDFFETLPMKVEKDCLTTGTNQKFCSNETYKLQFFINGERSETALNEVIKHNDQLLITYDTNESINIPTQLNTLKSL